MEEEQGPFDRILQSEPPKEGDRAAIIIVAAGIVLGLILLLLVLPPISILDDGGEATDISLGITIARDELPSLPTGFEAVSALYDLSSTEPLRLPARLGVLLTTSLAEGTPLVLFTYRDGAWQRLGTATVEADGLAWGEVPILPANIAALRPTVQARIVLGSLPLGEELDQQALDSLTMLNPAGFTFDRDGRITGGPLELPADLSVSIAPTISALTPAEAKALDAILASPELRTQHVQAILAFARENSVAGIDLDYRALDPVREADFVSLVQELSTGLRGEGRTLSLTIPMPERQGDVWDTLGFDWPALMPHVTAVKLAPEEDPEQYHQRTEEALAYLVARVPSSKLLLVVASLSSERGAVGMRTLTLTEALSLASTPVAQPTGPITSEATVQLVGQNLAEELGASELRWDDGARAVVFSYAGLGGERTVWIANVFSEAFKLDLARRYQLGGVAVTNVSQSAADANIWPAVRQYAETGEVVLIEPNGGLLQPQWILP
ncbi:MAG: glycosyl hydrolase family 18 protein [Dehalococcoidia bacterium]